MDVAACDRKNGWHDAHGADFRNQRVTDYLAIV
jgi:hypothetical protein